ncbi:cyclopropane-fatty-acyl-phospholipid synthase [Actibacterium mucosum KCTC 23349]|uniref:Cyclopropane-fatty-acyl-phospholipid synthase n=1 Tax=Actibacterium mucosum KCTC 23349 TaxID=1454373 RepID=A0A037ZN23_9RHOB|nr:DUF1365 domain-containing protein [Actibacterium mucosum]KAJ56241.1 cyclopropane-fatty-acyl-phospholipid synthase [Actibacterium mucosum KCTC 23349]
MNAEIIPARTFHARTGGPNNRFAYRVDYVLIDPDATTMPSLFSRHKWNLAMVLDRHHGGSPNRGQGAAWAREVFAAHGLASRPGLRPFLLTQPRWFGVGFNPVSFWLMMDGDDLLGVISEVTNTFGDRHSYLCRHPDFAPIQATDTLQTTKILHVSPFQDVAGRYEFGFDITRDSLCIRIVHKNAGKGVVATLTGPRRPLTNGALLGALLRRPLAPVRTIALIHWQALKLWAKGAPYKTRPTPPGEEVS